MVFDKAVEIMEKGGHVESLVSNTEYSMDLKENRLYSEGLPVGKNYITKEEMIGEWREVYIVQTKEDMDKLSEKERNTLIEETLKGVKQKIKFDEEHRRV